MVDVTGAALAYDERDIKSIQTRVGLAAALRLETGGALFVPYGEAYYIHEFSNDQEAIRARFVGDGRGANATFFQFKTNEPDRNFFQVGGGLTAQFSMIPLELGFGIRSIIDNDLYDFYEIEGGLRLRF